MDEIESRAQVRPGRNRLGFLLGILLYHGSAAGVSAQKESKRAHLGLSKFPELFDTVLVVLRKKPLLFVQYFHHSATLLYCFYSFWVEIDGGIWFCALNLCVHSCMYTYYALATSHLCRIPRGVRRFVTTLQLSQMIIALGVTLHNLIVCNRHPINYLSCLVMYAIYTGLFADLLRGSTKAHGETQSRPTTVKKEDEQTPKRTAPIRTAPREKRPIPE
ncbi:putative fatty acid elongase [Paratrimastix pyriformis]|uniref:Elongation of fatty acids protein n=1 Tax=Paratrimastix pyriformis TaxID=342808 RepID=A0ABQ8UNV2_9EUKA|nr:putative fatty acid elongase [Paratrimastix pyriformis]